MLKIHSGGFRMSRIIFRLSSHGDPVEAAHPDFLPSNELNQFPEPLEVV